MEKINLREVVERSSKIDGDLKNNSLDDFLNISSDQRYGARYLVELGLRRVHDEEKHGDLDAWSREAPFGVEVYEEFDLDYDVFDKLIDERIKRDLNQITPQVQERGLDGSSSLSNLKDFVRGIFDDYEEIKSNGSVDDYLWVCEGFLEMGEEEVELERFIAAQYLFQKNCEHRVNSVVRNVGLQVKDKFPDASEKLPDLKDKFKNLFGSN